MGKDCWENHASYLREMTRGSSDDDEPEKISTIKATTKKPGWYNVRAVANEPAEILIYDEISSWGITAAAFVKDLNAVRAKQITLRLNSPGGNVFDGMAIHTALKNHPATVTVQVDGLAASIASIIAMAGDTIHMAENAFLMIHNAWGAFVGNSSEMEKMSETLDKIDTQMLRIYARRSGQPEEKIREMMAAETWMSAEEAQGFGFADTIGEPIAAAAMFDLSKFRNVPANLNAKAQPETLRESERRFRNKGHSRREAEALAVEHQKNLNGENDMTPEQISKIEAVAAGLGEIKILKGQFEAEMAKRGRLSLGGGSGPLPGEKSEEMKAFVRFLRNHDAGEYRAAVNVTTDSEGGFGVPEELDKQVAYLAKNLEPMRQVSNVKQIGSPGYVKLVSTGGVTAGWVGEQDARPETVSPGLAALIPAMGEIYCMPSATQQSLDDIFFSVEEWLVEEAARRFATMENLAFTTGDGVGQPKGFLDYPTAATADGTRPFGTIQYVATGEAATFKAATATVSPADILFDVIAALKPAYRQNATWMMNRQTLATVRKWKDAVNGSFIYAPSLILGQPETLCGLPLVTNEDMPNVGAGTFPIALGDFRQAFYITDRKGLRLLVDPYTSRPFVNFYMTKRTGSMLVLDEAIKLVKISA